MRCLWSVIAAVVVAFTTSASAQEQSVSRVARGEPNTDIRVGVYLNVRPDCTSGPLPSIQLTSPPENGKVTVKEAMVTATNYKQCLALEVPAFIAFYRSRADFVGVDVLTLEFPNGKTQVQRISVTVGSGAPGRST
jgi:hypothetical protein